MSKCVSVTGHRLALGTDVASLGRVTLYAAYGTNLDPARMSERCPHSPLRSTGWLTGWRLTFGGEEHGWDGALATIVEDPIEQVFVAVYDVTPEDETELDRWESADTGLYRKTRVRVSTMSGEQVVWAYVLDAYEGGLPSASYLGVLADAAEAADAPADYVAAPAAPRLPVDGTLSPPGHAPRGRASWAARPMATMSVCGRPAAVEVDPVRAVGGAPDLDGAQRAAGDLGGVHGPDRPAASGGRGRPPLRPDRERVHGQQAGQRDVVAGLLEDLAHRALLGRLRQVHPAAGQRPAGSATPSPFHHARRIRRSSTTTAYAASRVSYSV